MSTVKILTQTCLFYGGKEYPPNIEVEVTEDVASDLGWPVVEEKPRKQKPARAALG